MGLHECDVPSFILSITTSRRRRLDTFGPHRMLDIQAFHKSINEYVCIEF